MARGRVLWLGNVDAHVAWTGRPGGSLAQSGSLSTRFGETPTF